MKAVITVIGKDQVGIIARVSNLLYKHEINILDISQTIMQELFTMIMIVDMQGAHIGDISEEIKALEKEMNSSIHVQNEDIFNSMHRI